MAFVNARLCNQHTVATDWWYGYQTSVKQAVKLESQGFDGELEIICIKGGFITQLEAAKMEQIMTEATADCLKSDINVKYKIKKVSYLQFLLEYDSGSLTPEAQSLSSNTSTSVTINPDEAMNARDKDVHAQLAEAYAQLAAKDEQLQQLRVQLARFEGVPPQPE